MSTTGTEIAAAVTSTAITGGATRATNTTVDARQVLPDPLEVFLARAAARDRLVQSGDMTPAEAFEGLIPSFLEILSHRRSPC